ncbi:MAG: phage antirepressor KilAC domain-containing protein [Clostridia bacterium]|nr:phage antirepressor KilAC domain-containing protein [Clostridia bacterium]
MNELRVFENKDFGKVRVQIINNEAWFCLKDVCEVLDIKNISDCKNRLKKDGVVTTEVIDNLGRKQQANFVNESNLYKVIFQSRKEEAEKFTGWVTSEVLPSIRRNGGYILDQENLSDDELLAKALLVAQSKIAEKDKIIEEQKHKVLFADSVSASKKSILVREMAKYLCQNGIDIGEKRLFKILRKNGYLVSKYGDDYNTPTQKSMNLGLFELKKTTILHSNGYETTSKTPKITGKGQIYFVNKFLKGEMKNV